MIRLIKRFVQEIHSEIKTLQKSLQSLQSFMTCIKIMDK